MGKNRILLAGLLLSSLLVFSACQSTHSPDPSKVKEMALNQEKRMGVIESLGGAKISSQATHLLRMDNGTTLFLKSPVMDLADAKYAAKEVEVAGDILRTTDGNEVMDVMNIDLVDRATNVTEEVPQWVDYSSDNLQVSLKYRDDYKLQEETDKLVMVKTEKVDNSASSGSTAGIQNSGKTPATTEKKEATITVKLISKDPNYSLLEAMGVPTDSTADLLSKGYNKSKITQKALDAYKQSSPDGMQISYFIKSGYSYQILFNIGQTDTQVTDQNMFFDILASIDFGGITSTGSTNNAAPVSNDQEVEDSRSTLETDQSSLNGFQKFTSEAMKFSVQYPKSYYFGNGNAITSGAIKDYVFSDKPLEDNGAKIDLEIVKGNVPDGKQTMVGGKNAIVTSSGGDTDIYVNWSNGQYFHFKGLDSSKPLMQQMASTLEF